MWLTQRILDCLEPNIGLTNVTTLRLVVTTHPTDVLERGAEVSFDIYMEIVWSRSY